MERYGTTNNMDIPGVREKIKNTNMSKYNVENPFGNQDIKNKIKNTNIKRYGTKYPTQNAEIKNKIELTNRNNHNGLWNTQTEECKEKIKNTNLKNYGVGTYVVSHDYHKKRGQGYFYKSEYFDSSWELAYWIYCIDHNIDIKRNTTPHSLGNGHQIYFDFISNGRYVEIKGDYLKKSEDWNYKLEAYIKYDVKVLFKKDIEPILNYIYKKYGKNYLKKFRDKKHSDFKRKIIEVNFNDLESLEFYKNKNVRFHYTCKDCGKEVFTTYKILMNFKDQLCKQCRNKKI